MKGLLPAEGKSEMQDQLMYHLRQTTGFQPVRRRLEEPPSRERVSVEGLDKR